MSHHLCKVRPYGPSKHNFTVLQLGINIDIAWSDIFNTVRLQFYSVLRKTELPAFCISVKNVQQLRSNHAADQCLYFHFIDRKYIRNLKPLAIFCDCTALFVSDLVKNHRVFCDGAQISSSFLHKLHMYFYYSPYTILWKPPFCKSYQYHCAGVVLFQNLCGTVLLQILTPTVNKLSPFLQYSPFYKANFQKLTHRKDMTSCVGLVCFDPCVNILSTIINELSPFYHTDNPIIFFLQS